MILGKIGRLLAPLALAFAATAPAQAENVVLEAAFDTTFGTGPAVPRDFTTAYDSEFERLVAQLAGSDRGRIGVHAIDLTSGREISVLGDERFPMASTSKIAIAATYLEGVDQGRWTLTREYPMLVPLSSRPFSSAVAPVRPGNYYSARDLIEQMITRSSNSATDALLAAVGGPAAVNDWARRAGIPGFNLTRDIATLVRDDGEYDPASHIDIRDSSTPRDMVTLLTGIYQGKWLSAASRQVIVGAMERCRTGTRRIPAMLPAGVTVAHKTGSLNNTSSDIGIVTGPDGRSIAVAIYVTGQGTRANREAKIASIARALYDGYAQDYARRQGRSWTDARYDAQPGG